MVMMALLVVFVVAVGASVLLQRFAPFRFEKIRIKLDRILKTKTYRYFGYAFWVWFVAALFIRPLNHPLIAFPVLLIAFLPAFRWSMGKARVIRRKVAILG
jgi:hypothetical protein